MSGLYHGEEAENEEQAKELGYIMPWPHADACSFFEVEEDMEDDDDNND